MKCPTSASTYAILLCLILLLSGVVLVAKDSQGQVYSSFLASYANPKLQVQCIHTPLWPQPNQNVTITATAVNGSLAPKVVNSIEIVVNTSRSTLLPSTKNVNNNSSLNYTIGPFTNGTMISYGCRATDNSISSTLFTGMKRTVVGAFTEGRAVPVALTGNPSNNLDILFIADNKTFSSPTDANFLGDVEKAIQIFYNQSIFLENQNKTNFWIAQDMGEAKNRCESVPPANWFNAYLLFDAAVILHRDNSIRDCTRNDKEISSANVATAIGQGHLLLHEIGHRPFGLADEYDSGGFYESSSPYQNVFDGNATCIKNGLGTTCRSIPYTYGQNKYFTSDTEPNDLMVDNKQFQALDDRRIEMWFMQCLTPPDNNPPPPPWCKAQR